MSSVHWGAVVAAFAAATNLCHVLKSTIFDVPLSIAIWLELGPMLAPMLFSLVDVLHSASQCLSSVLKEDAILALSTLFAMSLLVFQCSAPVLMMLYSAWLLFLQLERFVSSYFKFATEADRIVNYTTVVPPIR